MPARNLYKRARSPYWWIRYRGPDGILRRESTRCVDQRAAVEYLRRVERSAQNPTRYPRGNATTGSITLHAALEQWLSNDSVGLSAATREVRAQKGSHLARLLGALPVAQAGRLNYDAYIATRISEGAHVETVRKELSALRGALRYAVSQGWAADGAADAVPKIPGAYVPRTRYLTPSELAALLSELEPHRRVWVALAVYTGGRKSEIAGLRWSDIDQPPGWVLLRGTKTKSAVRRVPLAPVLRGILETLERPSDLHTTIARRWHTVSRDLARACQRAGIPTVSANDLRRTFASLLVQNGAPLKSVASLLGHTSTTMVDRVYGQMADEVLVASVRKTFG